MSTSDGFGYATLSNGWVVGRFSALQAAGACHAVTTTRALDVDLFRNDLAAASSRLAAGLGLAGVAYVDQVHGSKVRVADRGGFHGQADGLVTTAEGLGIMTRGADCPLILAADPAARVVGAAHASWRGTVAKIAMELVRQMQAVGATPADIVAGICPSAGPCCYEVRQDVLDAAVAGIGPGAANFFIQRDGKNYFDLWAANRDQLLHAGLSSRNVHTSGVCTMCQDMFPSHRRQGSAAGRFAAVIALSTTTTKNSQ